MSKQIPKGYVDTKKIVEVLKISYHTLCIFLNTGLLKTLNTPRKFSTRNIKKAFVETKGLNKIIHEFKNENFMFTNLDKGQRMTLLHRHFEYKSLVEKEKKYIERIKNLENNLKKTESSLKKYKNKCNNLKKMIIRTQKRTESLIKLTAECYNDPYMNSKKIITRSDLIKKCFTMNLQNLLQENKKTHQPQPILKTCAWTIFRDSFSYTNRLYEINKGFVEKKSK
ncbi:hypothetical protein ACTVJH_09550 [Desulfoplanes sp. PS50]